MTTPLAPLAARRALFVSWVGHHGRSEELARALGAQCAFVAVGTLRNRRTAPLRHAWQALRTALLLVRTRPRVLLVMAPPPALVAIGLIWRRLTGGRLVVDCHSGAVLGRPLSARLADRADLVVVTLPQLTSGFSRAVAMHNPPAVIPAAPRHGEVVFPASWLPDEPVEQFLVAARALPDQRFAVTGRPPRGVDVPPNVRLTGFLPRADYLRLVAGAPVVLALTTRPDTMQQAAYEAVGAGRPVVASDTAALRSYLGDAATYAGDLAAALTDALERLPALELAVARVRVEQEHAFGEALAQLVRSVA